MRLAVAAIGLAVAAGAIPFWVTFSAIGPAGIFSTLLASVLAAPFVIGALWAWWNHSHAIRTEPRTAAVVGFACGLWCGIVVLWTSWCYFALLVWFGARYQLTPW